MPTNCVPFHSCVVTKESLLFAKSCLLASYIAHYPNNTLVNNAATLHRHNAPVIRGQTFLKMPSTMTDHRSTENAPCAKNNISHRIQGLIKDCSVSRDHRLQTTQPHPIYESIQHATAHTPSTSYGSALKTIHKQARLILHHHYIIYLPAQQNISPSQP